MSRTIFVVAQLCLMVTAGCGRPDVPEAATVRRPGAPQAMSLIPSSHDRSPAELSAAIDSADVSVLFLGNSHSTPIPGILSRMFDRHCPALNVYARSGPSLDFLAEQANNDAVVSLVQDFPWDYVVLQAQKYSTSGKHSYPIDGAVKLARFASENGARVILYPEFPRRGVDEYSRIRAVHESIAAEVDVQIAPIGEAWDLALETTAEASLYSADGNHASELGNYLVSAVFFRLVCPETTEFEVAKPLHESLWIAATEAATIGQTATE